MAKPKNPKTKELSIVTLPLKCEIWQRDDLTKRFELARQTYNTMLGGVMKKYNRMIRLPSYMEARKTIKECYSDPEKRKTQECRAALDQLNILYREYGFTEFGFMHEIGKYYKYFSLPSAVACRSIASPMWAAFQTLLYGNGETVHFKKKDQLNSLVSDARSGIRIVNREGDTMLHGSSTEPMYLQVTARMKPKKILKIPIVLPKNDPYKAEMVDRDIRMVRIIRAWVRDNWRYSVQLTVEGPPAAKTDRDGNPKHTIGKGYVGLYINTRHLWVESGTKSFCIDLSQGFEHFDERKNQLQQYMDTSRRINNPDNFNEDGTIKNGIMKNGKRQRLHWNNSNGYRKARNELKNNYRVESINRALSRRQIVYRILECGDHIIVNDYPFSAAAMKKKETEYSKKTGRPLSKKKGGKAISANAPAMLLTFLDSTLKAHGLPPCDRIRISDDDLSRKGEDSFGKDMARKMLEEADNPLRTKKNYHLELLPDGTVRTSTDKIQEKE